MRGPSDRDHLALAINRIVETKPRAAQVAAARVHDERVVEAGRLQVPEMRLEHERLQALVPEHLVPAGEDAEILHAGDLEPDEVGGIVGDALRIGLRETDANRGRKGVSLHGATFAVSREGHLL